MTIEIDKKCSIFFGDIQNCTVGHNDPGFKNFCQNLTKKLKVSHVVIQNQVHGTDGWNITDIAELPEQISLRERTGDFLITNQPNIGIAVLTADCLPIIFYDPVKNVIASAHAGWRGSVAHIATKVIQELVSKHKSRLADIKVFFGPSARSCCYEVQPDFLINLEKFSHKEKLVTKRDDKLFFDNTLLNKFLLLEAGIKQTQISLDYNLCTICNHQFNSYRRAANKNTYAAQPTIVWLKK